MKDSTEYMILIIGVCFIIISGGYFVGVDIDRSYTNSILPFANAQTPSPALRIDFVIFFDVQYADNALTIRDNLKNQIQTYDVEFENIKIKKQRYTAGKGDDYIQVTGSLTFTKTQHANAFYSTSENWAGNNEQFIIYAKMSKVVSTHHLPAEYQKACLLIQSFEVGDIDDLFARF